ncbi:hypothetical protein DEIPH_ctg033orf0184 [Deinococcus phoenicis]|uniref:Uncharacterized protein n=1 Tax=Deinococcus phoenicis TaxID=1476583 RepID=A0A016QPP3_9DEIO|nr:hypothetical protein [Deinococcus phoenicis]EYB67749.1 hypothetical protein DEIPH_ctg033orf0184 [Deinococcus phoenicis]
MPLPEPLWPEVAAILVGALGHCGVETLEAMHGWSASDFGEHPAFGAWQWVPFSVQLSDVPALLRERQAQGLCLGRDDWFLSGTVPFVWAVKLCHEGDLHLQTDEPALLAWLKDQLEPLGIQLVRHDARQKRRVP